MKNAQKFAFKSIAFSLFLLIGFSSCCDHKTEEVAAVKAEEVNSIIIPLKQAEEMYKTYTVRREGLIKNFEDSLDRKGEYDPKVQQNNNEKENEEKASVQISADGFQPTRYIHYDYKLLKKYLAFIEQEAKRANVNISTLRFYLTNYPDKDKFDNNREVKDRRRNTVVMVPSLNKGGKEHAFFTGDDNEDGMKRKAFLLTDELIEDGTSYTEGNQEKASFSLNFLNLSAPLPVENQQSLAGNEGGLRPPK